MQDPRRTSPEPRQLLMPLDSTRLRGMSPLDRGAAVTRLANLLLEAARTVVEERNDDGR
jgi:hypothetical protein